MEIKTNQSTHNKPKKPLRSILALWFLLFSIAPLAFVTGYSLVQFESSMNEELNKRLKGNAREIEVMLNEYETYLLINSRSHAADPSFVFNLSTNSVPNIRRIATQWLKNYTAHHISLFDREGRLVVALVRGPDNQIQSQSNLESGEFYLAEKTLNQLKTENQIYFRDIRTKYGLELVVYTRVLSSKGINVGYIEETMMIDQNAINGIKKRLNLEILLLDSEMKPVLSTREEFKNLPATFFKEITEGKKEGVFEVTSRENRYGFIISSLKSGNSTISLGLAASMRELKNVTRGINRALFSVVGIIILLLVITLLSASNLVLKPLKHLVEAAQKIEGGAVGTQIEVESETEIGLLTESFNKMSKRIAEARAQLESKIQELELTNRELQETQAQLVQTAKMVSLGQLVAGVAHELNNPIGFIYSNMSHLKDYSERLTHLVEVAEKNPKKLSAAKDEAEFDYVMRDMPRLIKSCEDGARRVRDIVIGLRNFSRLDEYQLKDVDIEEGLTNTLNLLAGELKNRIQVETRFGHVPTVKCYANQINQVFMNLLTNATQSIDGDGTLWVETESRGDAVYIRIRDSGKGIPTTVVDKIFDPFFTTKPIGQGTGLGLSISYGIIKKHNGEIKVKSEEGKGTEFTVILPRSGPTENVA